jgi:hypothetical protein
MRRAAQAWLHSKDADHHRRDVDITARNACIKEVERNFRELTKEEQYLRRARSWGLFNKLLKPEDVLAGEGDDQTDEMPADATRERVAANLRTLLEDHGILTAYDATRT